jgi:hypothetical protein
MAEVSTPGKSGSLSACRRAYVEPSAKKGKKTRRSVMFTYHSPTSSLATVSHIHTHTHKHTHARGRVQTHTHTSLPWFASWFHHTPIETCCTYLHRNHAFTATKALIIAVIASVVLVAAAVALMRNRTKKNISKGRPSTYFTLFHNTVWGFINECASGRWGWCVCMSGCDGSVCVCKCVVRECKRACVRAFL